MSRGAHRHTYQLARQGVGFQVTSSRAVHYYNLYRLRMSCSLNLHVTTTNTTQVHILSYSCHHKGMSFRKRHPADFWQTRCGRLVPHRCLAGTGFLSALRRLDLSTGPRLRRQNCQGWFEHEGRLRGKRQSVSLSHSGGNISP